MACLTSTFLSYFDTQIHLLAPFFAPYFIDGNIAMWAYRPLKVLRLVVAGSYHGDFEIPHLGHELHEVHLELV